VKPPEGLAAPVTILNKDGVVVRVADPREFWAKQRMEVKRGHRHIGVPASKAERSSEKNV
jgi:hypothetical protein